jgi:hypothetical protein
MTIPARRQSNSRKQGPEPRKEEIEVVSDSRPKRPLSPRRQPGPRSRTPDKRRKREELSESIKNNWHKGRREWRADRDLRARSQSPGERKLPFPTESTKLPTKNARPYDLKKFWREEDAAAWQRWKDKVEAGKPKPRSRSDPGARPIEGWRQAQIYELKRPVNLSPDLVQRINEKRGPGLRQKHPQKPKEAEELPPATATIKEPELPPSILKTPKKTREEHLAEIQARFPSWVAAADQNPEWFAEAKRQLEEQEAERTARDIRNRQRLENWKARGPVPRRYVQVIWADKRPPPYVEPSEDDIIGLETQLANSGFCSVARTEPLLLSVPNGFKLVFSTADATKLQRMKLGMGILASQLSSLITDPGVKPKSVGYHAEYLNASSATELVGLKPSNLTHEIHPILRRGMWHDIPDDVYEVLLPGLRLATRFLWHPACVSHWLAVFYGDQVIDPDASAKKGAPVVRIPNRVEFSYELAERLQREVFLPLVDHAHFQFGLGPWRNDPDDHQHHTIWGRSGAVPNFGLEWQRQDMQGAVWLQKDFLTVAKKYARLKDGANTAERLRFNFTFAVTLTHEIAHTAVGRTVFNKGGIPYWSEPIMYNENIAEAGTSWEINTFGGIMDGIDNRVDGKFGMAVSVADPEHKLLSYPVPMGYVEELQQQETWDMLHSLQNFNNPAILCVPQVLIPTYGLMTFVMREPLLDFLKLHHPEVFPATAKEEALIGSLLPFGTDLTGVALHDRYKLLLERMASRDTGSDQEIIAMWELWWQYEAVGWWATVQDEKKWLLLENYWRLCGGKSSSFTVKRYNNDLSSIPDRFNPLIMGSWGESEIQEYLQKREEKLGIPASVPWDKQEDTSTTSNSDDTPPHERTEFGHHPRGYGSPENPWKDLPVRLPGESHEEFLARTRGDPMSIDRPSFNTERRWPPTGRQPARYRP